MDTFTWGIIGPGNIATEFAEDLQYIRDAKHRVGAVLSHDLGKAASFAAKEGAPQYFDNIDDFLAKAAVDAVYIATPHPLHYDETLKCLQHHIPVLCEKPLAMNSRQVQEMIDTAIEYDTFLLEGMWVRFLPSIDTLLKLVEEDTIGKIHAIKATMSFKAPYDPESRYFNREKGGGSLLDLGVYPVFLSHLLLGKPEQVHAHAKLSDQGIDESCAALFNYHDGSYALIDSSLIIQTSLLATIYGEKGKITMLPNWNEKPEGILQEMYDGQVIRHPCVWEGRGLQFEAMEAYACIRQGKIYSEKFCHQFSLDLMQTMDAIRQQTHVTYPSDQQIITHGG